MIHLSEISINPAAIAYIQWNAVAPGTRPSDERRGVLIHFLVPTGDEFGQKPDYWFIPEDSDDINILRSSVY